MNDGTSLPMTFVKSEAVPTLSSSSWANTPTGTGLSGHRSARRAGTQGDDFLDVSGIGRFLCCRLCRIHGPHEQLRKAQTDHESSKGTPRATQADPS